MRHTTFALLLVLVGCTVAPPAVQRAPREVVRAPASARDVGAPVVASWVERDVPATRQGGTPGRYLLGARVAQPGDLGLPLDVRVVLPAGAVLLRGDAHQIVQPGDPGSVHEFVLEIDAPVVPVDDLVLVVDAQGEHAGVHAEARYRFGRPEPVAPQTPLAREALVVGGRDFGRPVQMTR